MVYRAPFAGVFATMEFPRYEFKEFPKWVRTVGPDGETVEQLVDNAREELALLADTPLVRSQTERERDELVGALAKEQDKTTAMEAQMEAMKLQLDALLAKTDAPPPPAAPAAERKTFAMGAK